MKFNFFKKPTKSELTEKELIDKELALYKEKKILEIDIMVLNYKNVRSKEMLELSLACNRQTGEYEHTFHSKRESLGIEIAKLEATKEYLESQVEIYNRKLLKN